MIATYEIHCPPEIVLPGQDEAIVLPSGRSVSGSRARVYEFLRQVGSLGLSLPVGTAWAPSGRAPGSYLIAPWSGGSEGLKRLRELRLEYGVGYECERFTAPGGAVTNSFLYWLTGAGAQAATVPRAETLASGLAVTVCRCTPLEAAGLALQLGASSVQLAARPTLRPPAELLERTAIGAIPSLEADAAYRAYLLGLYRAGTLAREIDALRPAVVLWDVPAGWSGVGRLAASLDRLGAAVTHLSAETGG